MPSRETAPVAEGARRQDWAPKGASESELFADYERARRECPVARTDDWGGFWLLSRHEDVAAAARDTATFESFEPFVERRGSGEIIPLTLNGDRHRFFRKLLAPYFTPARIKRLEPLVREMVREYLDELTAAGHGDAYAALANPLPARTLCAFLNVPDEEWSVMKDLSRLVAEHGEAGPEAQRLIEEAFKAKAREYTARRNSEPLDPETDVFSGLLAARLDGQPLDEDTVAVVGWQLIAAGHSTTTRAITVAIHHLAAHPYDFQRLKADASMIRTAVEELLRIGPPLHQMARRLTRDVQLHGRKLAAGDTVALGFAAANFDPDVFEDPVRCDLARTPTRHMTFGIGPHICIGAPLARMELRVMLEELVARVGVLELAGVSVPFGGLRSGFSRLPVRVVSAGHQPA